jgi:hypothetical protein
MRDHLEELRAFSRAYHETEQDFIKTSGLCEAEMENYLDSYMWLSLPIPDEHPETVADMILSGVEDLPNTCLAGILVAILKKSDTKGVHFQGMSIDKVGSSFCFCISGSISLEGLRTLCAQYEPHHDLGD